MLPQLKSFFFHRPIYSLCSLQGPFWPGPCGDLGNHGPRGKVAASLQAPCKVHFLQEKNEHFCFSARFSCYELNQKQKLLDIKNFQNACWRQQLKKVMARQGFCWRRIMAS
jgi:hypothetical protein